MPVKLSTISGFLLSSYVWLGMSVAKAAEYGGAGLAGGVTEAGTVVGNDDLRSSIIRIVERVLSYMALAALVVIVVAGILLVVSGGTDESRDRSRRMIFYAIIGLIIILLARGLVMIFTDPTLTTT